MTSDQQNPLVRLFCYPLEIGKDAQIAIIPGCHPVNARIVIAHTYFEPIHQTCVKSG
jgi:hypothetical protein